MKSLQQTAIQGGLMAVGDLWATEQAKWGLNPKRQHEC